MKSYMLELTHPLIVFYCEAPSPQGQIAQLPRLHSCLRELNQIMNMLGEFPDKKLETLQFGMIIIPVLIRKF